jgi:diacylglycerol O-acyltransferase
VHHCVADGVALVRLLLALTEHESPATPAAVGAAPPGTGRHPLRSAVGLLRSLAHDLRLPPDPATPLQGRLGVQKRVAWSRPHPLARLADGAHRAKVTLNDVVLAATAGALRRYLLARTGSPPRSDVRALVPVNLRRLGSDPEAGNRFGLVYVTLPLTQASAGDRIAVVRQRMDAIKQTPEAVMAFGVLGAMGLANAAVERFGVDLFTKKATVLVTSIPGPTAPLRLAGHEIEALLVWAPASGGIGITISVLTYAGRLQIGIRADARLVPDPAAIAAALDDELTAAAGWLPR